MKSPALKGTANTVFPEEVHLLLAFVRRITDTKANMITQPCFLVVVAYFQPLQTTVLNSQAYIS